MALSEAVSRPFTDVSATPEDAEATSGGKKTAAVLLATVLTLGATGALGYTQWWIPREQAQQAAQLRYEQCLQDVKVYRKKHSYKARLAQCNRIPHTVPTPAAGR